MPGADLNRELVVSARNPVADDVVELVLASADGLALPAWEPGAHVTLSLPEGLLREYSLCGPDTSDGTWTIAVHRAPDSRGGSRFVHDHLTVGTNVTVSGPANNFPLAADERQVLVAGGIGITPILTMARAIRARGATVTMLYCGRSRSLMAYRDEIAAWGEPGVVLHADDERGGPPDLSAFLDEHAGATVYCCGPEPLIAAVEKKAPAGSPVQVERFRGVAADTSEDEEFDVVVSGADQRVRVHVGESILDALARAGFDVPSSCREGICGTCETAVVRGVPDHRDTVLGEEERADGELIMPCVSRSRTPEIELDLF
ncbi:PDR/VanB family oxidoreductase [Amycolatopsis sp. NPDC005232]|uniref:PDR/VanB family oxidoreductase n=1 Tax=Amycolatopsis sp. NPDC005232 TaxID=3157027 RepID=UPI0033A40F0C